MIYGNAAWGFRETPLEEQFRITRDLGLTALELGIANAPNDVPLDVTNERLAQIKALESKYGVRMLCAATGNDFTTGNGDIPKIKRVMDICAALEIPMLRIFAGFTAKEAVSEAAFDSMLESLTEICRYGEAKGVTPVIETHGGVNGFDDGVEHFESVTTDMASLTRILSALPDNARICFDPANLYAVGHSHPEQFFETFRDKVAYAHFKDFASLPSGHLKPSHCGDSQMEWTPILKAMADFPGAAMFEYENVEDVEAGLRRSYEYIKNEVLL